MKSNVPFQDITGYIPVDVYFAKGLNQSNLFMVVAGNDNTKFGIKKGAYILCEIRKAKVGELVVDRESLNLEQSTYKVMKMVKQKDFTLLENSISKKIVKSDYENFGVVLRVFNINN